MAKKTESKAKVNKTEKGKIWVRIMATILAALMVLSVATSLIYYLAQH